MKHTHTHTPTYTPTHTQQQHVLLLPQITPNNTIIGLKKYDLKLWIKNIIP